MDSDVVIGFKYSVTHRSVITKGLIKLNFLILKYLVQLFYLKSVISGFNLNGSLKKRNNEERRKRMKERRKEREEKEKRRVSVTSCN